MTFSGVRIAVLFHITLLYAKEVGRTCQQRGSDENETPVSTTGSPRPYRMRARAEKLRDTRQRIVEATVRLHTTIGPAATSISAVAEAAGVSRPTVYRHFPDEESLYAACAGHFDVLYPPPDLDGWREIDGLEVRARHALTELYRYYEMHADRLHPIYRDVATMPAVVQQASREENEATADALIAGCDVRGRRRSRLRAVAGHLVDFWTWHSLVVEQGLETGEAVDLGCSLLGLAAGSPSRR